MTWLTPLVGGIVLASVIPPLLALYFLRLRRNRRAIPSTLLWKRETEDLRANAPFQRLRASLLLFLQLLVLVLLAIALMQPQLDAGERRGGKTIFLIDNSGSMNATDVDEGETRLGLAKILAMDRVEELHGGGLFGGMPGEVMVIAFNSDPEVRTPFTGSRTQALAAIRGIEPTDAVSRIGPALELARAYATVVDPENTDRSLADPAVLELFSDGRISDLGENVLQRTETVEYTVIGTVDAENASIVALAADRPYDDAGKVQIFAAFQNAGPSPVRSSVQLSVNGTVRLITPTPLEIPAARVEVDGTWVPGRRQMAFTPFEQPRDAVIEVELLHDDALPSDDVAALVVPPTRQLAVALVGRHSFEMLEMLKSLPLQSLELLSAAEFEARREANSLDGFDVVVLLDADVSVLPPGRYLSFGPTPPIDDLQEFGDPAIGVIVSRTMDDHPVLRYVNLDGLFVHALRKLVASGVARPIVESVEGPMVLEVDDGVVQMLHVAFDPLDSNWPIERSWANFVANAMEYLGSLGDALAHAGTAPGATLTGRIPRSAEQLVLHLPDGSSQEVSAVGTGAFAWGPARRVGLHELTWTDAEGQEGRRVFAVNQFDSEEGRIGAAETIAFSVDEVTGGSSDRTRRWTDLWPWLIGAALVLLLVEWWLWQRRAGAG